MSVIDFFSAVPPCETTNLNYFDLNGHKTHILQITCVCPCITFSQLRVLQFQMYTFYCRYLLTAYPIHHCSSFGKTSAVKLI